MIAIILAAGRGSRLGELTDQRPKCLVELHGKPLLARQAEALAQAGCTAVHAVVGYRAADVAALVPKTVCNPRWMQTNMVGSLICAAPLLRENSCVVSYSDIFYHPADVAGLMAAPQDIAIAYDPNWLDLWRRRFDDPLSDAESFAVNDDGYLVDIGHKVDDLGRIGGQYMGLLRFAPDGWRQIEDWLERQTPERRDRLDMTSMLSSLLEEGVTIGTYAITHPWGEVDCPSDLALYQSDPSRFGLA